ncbi:MAG TPA: endonuclease/exonuclease/phosphatase family protein [Cycloclasticus sp.]|jgi:endonuclease/exonuclease/phosphatase family metal-dependent hydrolase|nr:endonuclease/exonuclease/phosphatase family protein [Cycloclasticus sp.]HIL92385.1 endonuclease/exonuclease/phosphatase family protein [Cycloclasticus sp.]
MSIRVIFYRILLSLSVFLAAVFAAIWYSTFHPNPTQQEQVYCPADTPTLSAGQTVKLYNQNVQFMAGKNYVFFYDLANSLGPDERPSPTDIKQTLLGLAQLITEQNPDIILLQEVDDGAKRTDYADQLTELLTLLPKEYVCHASSMYWQASYLPHPKIMGAVGTKLSVISKYKISTATRTQLSLIPQDPISQLYNFKRALLDVRLPIKGAGKMAILNTHLSAFSKGTNTLSKQVDQIDTQLQTLNNNKTPWVIAGDFNLLPPDTHSLLAEQQRNSYQPTSAISSLYERHLAIPSLEDAQSGDRKNWFTYFPNDPRVKQPDRTIDYYFYSPQLTLKNAFVESKQSIALSDHMPIIAEFTLP